MLLHSLKVSVSVIAVVGLAYIFYPGGASTKPASSAKLSAHSTKTRHAKATSRTRKHTKQHTRQLAREEPIKPDRTLRDAQTQARSHRGPPSKMLGGL